jgi:hypothetical protein
VEKHEVAASIPLAAEKHVWRPVPGRHRLLGLGMKINNLGSLNIDRVFKVHDFVRPGEMLAHALPLV